MKEDDSPENCKTNMIQEIDVIEDPDRGLMCLDPAMLNQVFIRLVHRGPMLNDIFPKLNNVQYLSLIYANSGYHNLKLDKCYVGQYGY